MKILIVFGTRPEAIKLAPLIIALKNRSQISVKVCITGQHREMLRQVLEAFSLHPDYDLDLMRSHQDLCDITSGVILGLRSIFAKWVPDWVLVHGDTTSAFAAAIASFYHKIKIGHVEAGLRTGDIYSPWPEEFNRRAIANVATLNFCPTADAISNLKSEAVKHSSIIYTGNTGIDALIFASCKIQNEKKINSDLNIYFDFLDKNKKIILVTSHRRENFGSGLQSICAAINLIARRDDVQIIYPVHPNPSVSRTVHNLLADRKNIKLVAPLEYLHFIYLLKKSYIVLTDSGGLQEEAATLGKPVLILRETTERPEGLRVGASKLVGTISEKIAREAELLLEDYGEYQKMCNFTNLYGDGQASIRIINALEAFNHPVLIRKFI